MATHNGRVSHSGGSISTFSNKDRCSFLRVGSLNCQGLNKYYKRLALFEYLKNTNLAIIFLQETKLKPENEYEYVNEWHTKNCIFNSCPGEKSGTAILFNVPGIKIVSSKMVDIEGRVIAVDVDICGNRFHLVNSYGPNEYSNKIPFLNRLYLYFGAGRNIIWAGDHNIATNASLDRFPSRLTHDHGRKEYLDLIRTFDLKDNCRSLYPSEKYFTFRIGSSKSRIDKICTSSQLSVCEYYQQNSCFSNHELICSKISYWSSLNWGRGVWKNNTKLYRDEDLTQALILLWESNKNLPSLHNNLPKWWAEVKYKIKLKFIEFSKYKVVLQKRAAQMQDQGLYNITLALNNRPYDKKLVKEYNTAKEHVVKTRIQEVKEKILQGKAEYLMHGDKPTKSFFDKFKNRRENKGITCLKNEQGVEVHKINDILRVAENYFKNLFSGQSIRQEIVDLFLSGIFPKSSWVKLMEILLLPIEDEEIKDVIYGFLNDRCPGPDGLSIEFYKVMYPTIKEELKRLLNYYLNNGRMLSKFKAGIMKLIPKTSPLNDIEKTRPITLLNCDYKIYTKILSNRLQPILQELIHDSQYALPGKDINEMNNLVRDIINEMKISHADSFFVSIDFRKAFDTISHDFLFQVLEKYGFPVQFIQIIQELFRDAGSHIMINGHKSRKIKLKSGTRQGDPISRDVFILVKNPLLVFLNNMRLIRKYESLSRKQYLTFSFMDDLNLATQSISGVMNSLFYVKKFGMASGLNINVDKTCGLFINKTNSFSIAQLPSIAWGQDITVLKLKYGTDSHVQSHWDQMLDKFKNELKYFTDTAMTMKAKAIISKNKLLALLSYTGGTHLLPDKHRASIDKLMLKFLVPFMPYNSQSYDEVKDQISTFAAPKSLGGYEVDYITLHMDLLLLKPIMKYFKELNATNVLPDNLYFVEYNIGMQLCNYFNIRVNNSTTHANSPTLIYEYILKMIKWFKITLDELLEGSVNLIYRRIVRGMNRNLHSFKSYRILMKGLPSYLQSFNYKLHFNLLPVKTMFREYCLDNDSCCTFCGIGPESILHLFGSCEKLKIVWQFLNEVCFVMSNENFNFQKHRNDFHLDLTNINCNKTYEKTIIYLNSISNYAIWKMRNDIRYKFESFDAKVLLKKILRTIGGRKGVDLKLAPSYRIPFLQELFDSMLFVNNTFPFDNG